MTFQFETDEKTKVWLDNGNVIRLTQSEMKAISDYIMEDDCEILRDEMQDETEKILKMVEKITEDMDLLPCGDSFNKLLELQTYLEA